jgi:hypothetical protein
MTTAIHTDRSLRLRPATEALLDFQRSALPRTYQRKVTASPPSETTTEETTNASFDMTEIMTATVPLEQDVYSFPKIEWIPDDEDEAIYQQQTFNRPPDEDLINTSSHHSKSSPSLGKRSRLGYQGRLVRSKSLKSSLCYLADKAFSDQRRKLSFKSQKGSWGQFVQNDIEEDERMLRKLALSCHVVQCVKSNLSDLGSLQFPFLISGDEQKGLE